MKDESLRIRKKISNEFYNFYNRYHNSISDLLEKLDSNDPQFMFRKKHLSKVNDVKSMLMKTYEKEHILKELMEELCDVNFLKDMNKQSYVLPIKNNKLLDMDTLEIIERTYEHKFDFVCDAEYLVDMDSEREAFVRKYFMDLFCNNEAIMNCVLDIIKSSFTGELLRYMIFHTGVGRNGKSVFFKILSTIFPKSVMSVISKDVILEKKSNSHLNTEFEKLETCRVGYITELKETDKLNTTNIKAISGGDEIDVRSICQTNRSIEPVSTLHVLTNVLPKFDVEQAILDRLLMVPYNARFEVDKSFEKTIMGYKDEIFTFIMKYGKVRDNFKDVPEEMNVLKQQYAGDNETDYLKDFFEDRIEFSPSIRILRDELRLSYNDWCKQFDHCIDKTTNTKFTRTLKERFNITSKESHNKVYYVGIDWKQNKSTEAEFDYESD